MIIRPLCATVSPFPDESLASLLLRSAEENSVSRVNELLAHIGINAKKPSYVPFTQTERVEPLSQFLGVEAEQIQRRLHPRVDRPVHTIDWFGTPLERRFVEAESRRFGQVASGPHYGRVSWMIRPFYFCPDTFALLTDRCHACGTKQGWNKAVDQSRCESCDAVLLPSPETLAAQHQEAAAELSALLSHRRSDRSEVLSRLPDPFCLWEAGDVFSAAIELGTAWSAPVVDDDGLGRRVASGDFSGLGEVGMFEGWRIVKTWPDAFTELVDVITSRRIAAGGGWRGCVGPLSRHLHSKAADTPFRALLRETLPGVLRRLHVPVHRTASSKILNAERDGALTSTEVIENLGLDRRTLKKLVGKGDSFLASYPTTFGARLFDARLVEQSIEIAKTAPQTNKVAKLLKAPAYCISHLVDVGILARQADRDAQIIAGSAELLDEDSVQNLIYFQAANQGASEEARTLGSCLRNELNPHVWEAMIKGVHSGEIPSWRPLDGGNLLMDLLVDAEAFYQATAEARQQPLPDTAMSARAAEPFMGVSDVFLMAAAKAGFIDLAVKGLHVPSLAAFRTEFTVPSEVAKWAGMSAKAFCQVMRESGAFPVATLVRINLWRRLDVERRFPESVSLEFPRV